MQWLRASTQLAGASRLGVNLPQSGGRVTLENEIPHTSGSSLVYLNSHNVFFFFGKHLPLLEIPEYCPSGHCQPELTTDQAFPPIGGVNDMSSKLSKTVLQQATAF